MHPTSYSEVFWVRGGWDGGNKNFLLMKRQLYLSRVKELFGFTQTLFYAFYAKGFILLYTLSGDFGRDINRAKKTINHHTSSGN